MFTILFDTETGGLLPAHPTIALGAIAVDASWHEVASFDQRIAFNEADCDPEALTLNHYDRALWLETAVSTSVCAARFASWLRPYQSVTLTSKRTGQPYTVARMAGYNVEFDKPRLRDLFGDMFMPCELRMRDVLQLALWHFDERLDKPENFKLSTVAGYLGIPNDQAHGALADARMAAAVVRVIREGW